MSIGKKLSMNISKCHIHSDVQNQDKAFGMICLCVKVLRQNYAYVNVDVKWMLKITDRVFLCYLNLDRT